MRHSKAMSQATRLVTAEEFEHFSEDEAYRVELVRGRLVRMSPVGPVHARIVPRLIRVLGDYLDDHPVGEILADCGFKLESDPDTVRGPDVAFVRQERAPELQRPGWVRGAPDLVFEVLSPDDRPHEVREKLDDYFRAGVPVVIVVESDARHCLSLFSPRALVRRLGGSRQVALTCGAYQRLVNVLITTNVARPVVPR